MYWRSNRVSQSMANQIGMLLCVILVASGCTDSQADSQSKATASLSASTSATPGLQSEAMRKSFQSAARPCTPKAEDTYLQTDLKTLLQESERVFNAKPLAGILSQSGSGKPLPSITLPTQPETAVFYRSSNSTEMPVIVAGFGYGANVVDAFGILWYEKGVWMSQPYPQTTPEIAQQRNQVLSQGPFCAGLVTEVHQQGNLLAVVNDLGKRGTCAAQEVQLIKLENGTWKVVWVPTYEEWRSLGNTQVEFQDGLNSFIAHYQDFNNPGHQWQEVWKLQGMEYVKEGAMAKHSQGIAPP
jgi:hypothetical protein